ncbi:MAG: hypothetical protein K0Q47_159 [Sedimentibacter sp.]|jgi:hypothetical protein|nr:hypothetical protein [Sedimentibacter sp.]
MGVYEKVFKAAIVDYNTQEMKEFQYNPSSFSNNKSINFSAITIPGLNMPIYQFVSGGEEIIDIKLFLNALNHPKGGAGIKSDYLWYKKRTVAKRASNMLDVAPPKVLFVWPKIGTSKCIISSCNVEWTSFFKNGLPKTGELTLELKKTY